MMDSIDYRTGFKATEKRLIEQVKSLHVLLKKQPAESVALALLRNDVMIIIAPDEKSHAEVGSHQHFLHSVSPPKQLHS